jgi:hypothetical protein
MAQVGAVDREADIREFSQYQAEREILWVPLSLIAPYGPERLEIVGGLLLHVIPVRVSANPNVPTMVEMLGRRKRLHRASFRQLCTGMERRLRKTAEEQCAEARLSCDPYRVCIFGGQTLTHTVEGFLERIMDQVRQVLTRHEKATCEDYLDEQRYRALVGEMVEAGSGAESSLSLYLEDQNRNIRFMMQVSLRAAHRALASHVLRSMGRLEGKELRAAAERLCRLKGLLRESIGETNEVGEGPLVSAAADGVAGPAALALLITAGAEPNGDALRAAATHGNVEAVVTLIDAKAPIDSADEVETDIP